LFVSTIKLKKKEKKLGVFSNVDSLKLIIPPGGFRFFFSLREGENTPFFFTFQDAQWTTFSPPSLTFFCYFLAPFSISL
jgi:hypothetical protein